MEQAESNADLSAKGMTPHVTILSTGGMGFAI